MFHLVICGHGISGPPAPSSISQLRQLAERVDLTGADDWRGELEALCTAFVCADGKEGRSQRVRIAMLAAGAEGIDRMSREAIAKRMHVPQIVVPRATNRIYGLIRDAAEVGVLPHVRWLPEAVGMELGLESVLCARVVSEALGRPVGSRMRRYVQELYAGNCAPSLAQIRYSQYQIRYRANSGR